MKIGNKEIEQIIVAKDDEVVAVIADDEIIEKDGHKVIVSEKDNGILSDKFDRLVVYDEESKKEIAVITKKLVTTADDNITIKLKPSN